MYTDCLLTKYVPGPGGYIIHSIHYVSSEMRGPGHILFNIQGITLHFRIMVALKPYIK